MNSNSILKILIQSSTKERAKINAWFFKTGKGQYGEGDKFLGLSVPQIRSILKQYETPASVRLGFHREHFVGSEIPPKRKLSSRSSSSLRSKFSAKGDKNIDLSEISLLLENPYHEVRLFALLALVKQYPAQPERIYNLYLTKIRYVNNWDLVDLSAPYIVGPYLENKSKNILFRLAKSQNLWERRISIISTFYFIKIQKPEITLEIAEILIHDKHDLIQKAVGWMLREIGKRCSTEIEEKFLDQYASTMPRTTLRYAIEKFPPQQRLYYMGLKIKLRT